MQNTGGADWGEERRSPVLLSYSSTLHWLHWLWCNASSSSSHSWQSRLAFPVEECWVEEIVIMSLMRVKSDNWRNIAVNDFSGWHKVKLLCLCPSFEFKFNKLRSQLNLLFKMCQAEQEILAIIKQIFLCKFKWRDFMTELKALPYYQYQVTTHSCPPVWLCHAGEPPKYPVIRAN